MQARSVARRARVAIAVNPQSWRCLHTRPEEHDIVVIGGGPAGLTLGAALANSAVISSSHRVTLLEGNSLAPVRSWEPKPSSYSNRVSSVTARNQAFLAKCGVWQGIRHERIRNIEDMQVWDGLSGSRITFDSSGETTPGHMAAMVENTNLQRAALDRLDNASAEVIEGCKVVGITPGAGGWPTIELEGGRHLRARLLIGADGANSPVKSYSGIDTYGWAYETHGVVASLEFDASVDPRETGTAWQRFLPEGPIACLPLPGKKATLVWSTTPAIAAALKRVPVDALPHLVNAAFSLPHDSLQSVYAALLDGGEKCDVQTCTNLIESLTPPLFDHASIEDAVPPRVAAVEPGTVASFPLRLSHADSYLGPPRDGIDLRTVLVGDAAHTVHPLAGQGLNMGLGDIGCLVGLLEQLVHDGGDLGSYNALRPYARERYLANHLLLSTTDHLSSLYSSRLAPVVWARSTGLEVINELDSVKRILMRQAGAQRDTGRGGFWTGASSVMGGAMSLLDAARGLAGMAGSLAASRLQRRPMH